MRMMQSPSDASCSTDIDLVHPNYRKTSRHNQTMIGGGAGHRLLSCSSVGLVVIDTIVQ
jgi:hypothetical protein